MAVKGKQNAARSGIEEIKSIKSERAAGND